MSETITHNLLALLLIWAALSCAAAVVGLAKPRRPFWHAFLLMTGLWGVVDVLVAAGSLLYGPMSLADLSAILRFNAGLDGLYVAAGAILCTRPSPRWSVFGVAIVVQGLFLLVLDVYFWQVCEGAI